MRDVFLRVLSLSLSGSVLILALLAARPLFVNKLSRAGQYYLWLIVLLRLILPLTPTFGLTAGLFPETADPTPQVQRVSGSPADLQPAQDAAGDAESVLPAAGAPSAQDSPASPPADTPAGNAGSFDFLGALAVVWGVGAALSFAVKSARYAYFARKVKTEARPLSDGGVFEAFRDTAALAGIRKLPGLMVSTLVSSPMLLGLVKPAVLLPESALTAGKAGLPYIFRHELTHLRRRDILYKWAAELCLCVHWFNPLAYLMTRRIASSCELSCDEAVARHLDGEGRRAYGNALLDAAAEQSAGRRLKGAALREAEDKTSMKERLRTILGAHKKSKITVGVSIFLAVSLSLAGILLGACAAVGAPAAPSLSAGSAPAQAAAPSGDMTPAAASSGASSPTGASDSDAMGQNIVYKNTDYGFDFTLPKDWKGYKVVTEQWKGTPVGDTQQPEITGPQVLIRSPKWTKENPTQDIPIMVFTIDQFNAVAQEKYAVSAAPIPPSELGRNSVYVFALPARYNYAFLPGYEQVEQILSGKPLRPTKNIGVKPQETAAPSGQSAVVYKNTDYGFDFNLPADWKGYSVVTDKWEGYSVSDANKILATGPKLSIRSPKWTRENPTQDIPVMVFTLQQWDDLLKEKFAVSAAPVPPSELGRNSKYVFALPARYNFSFLPGYEEVEKIIAGKPLHANENFK
jgi:beta-lactamase regulating signal transducer with metallopeptidase domain